MQHNKTHRKVVIIVPKIILKNNSHFTLIYTLLIVWSVSSWYYLISLVLLLVVVVVGVVVVFLVIYLPIKINKIQIKKPVFWQRALKALNESSTTITLLIYGISIKKTINISGSSSLWKDNKHPPNQKKITADI